MSKRTTLLKLFDDMERDRVDLQQRLSKLSEFELTAKPGTDKWSVAQVITHLAIAEESALAYLWKKHGHGAHKTVPFTAELRMAALRTALKLPLKFKAPAVVATVPATPYSVAIVRWEKVRLELRNVYETLPDELLGHDLFKHPIAGKFDLIQSVRFMHDHIRHHEKQIKRTLRSVV